MKIERNVFVGRDEIKTPFSYVRLTNAIPIVFHFRDYTIPEGAEARVYSQKPSGKAVYGTGTIEGNSVSIDIKKQMFAELGRTYLQVQLISGEKELVTFAQPVDVKPNYTQGDAPESQNEDGFFGEIKESISQLSEEIANNTGGITTSFQSALLNFCANVAHINENGQELYDALELELTKITANIKVVGITATYTGGEVEAGTSLSDLTGITVYANYSDSSLVMVGGYELSGEIVEGENVITVSYNGYTTTFTVTGTPSTKVYLTFDSVIGNSVTMYSDDGESSITVGNLNGLYDSTQEIYERDVVVKFRFKINWATAYATGKVGSLDVDNKTVYRAVNHNNYYIEGNGTNYVINGNVYEGLYTLKAGTRFVAYLCSFAVTSTNDVDFTDCYAYIDLSEEV